LDSGPHLT